MTLAERIHEQVNKEYIESARKEGKNVINVEARDVHDDMGLEGRFPAIGSSRDADKFKQENRVIEKKRAGPLQSSPAE